MNFGSKILPELIVEVDYDSPLVPGLMKLHHQPRGEDVCCGMIIQEVMRAWVNEYISNL